MCDQTESEYLDGDVVWVKLGSCWWPGEVVGADKLPPDVLPSFRKPPIAVVKFFQESTYEYVKNVNCINKYNCSKKNEFINKGLYMYRTKHGHMEKFPEDVIRAETAVGGDIEILTRDEFQEQKKESYAGLFGDSAKKTPVFGKKGKGRGRPAAESTRTSTPTRRFYKEKTDYKVHILVQPSKEPSGQQKEGEKDGASTPSKSRAGSELPDDNKPAGTPSTPATPFTPSPSSSTSASGAYSCPNCSFSTTRLNVLILHNKTHSVTYTPYTPSPVRKKTVTKSPKSTPKTAKTPKTPRPRKEKSEKVPKKSQTKKRAAEEKAGAEAKKQKTDEEIKSSLLADWDDDADDESNDGTGLHITRSPELPVGSESPAAPTSAELPGALAKEPSLPEKKSSETASEKPETSSSDSKYEFCEDEEWHVEADAGRKIPRVKNPKRKEDTKSLSLDEDDVAKEVAELLNKTAVPELPSVPEPLKVEENFPEPSVVKSPDKKADNGPESSKSSETVNPERRPTKAIFKTKTFFRSRHSRSQDAIGKYVAEQLNQDRLEMADNELNGSDAVSSPEARESPPIDHVKVARLAPKIQLKKMKAEAAQLERERNRREVLEDKESEKMDTSESKLEYPELSLPTKPLQDVIYPTQEIKPINKESPSKLNYKEGTKQDVDKAEIMADKISELSKTEDFMPKENLPTEINRSKSQDAITEHVLNSSSTNSVKMLNIDQFSLDFTEEPLKEMPVLCNKDGNDYSAKESIRHQKLTNKTDNSDELDEFPQKASDLPPDEPNLSPKTSPEPKEQIAFTLKNDFVENTPQKSNDRENTPSSIIKENLAKEHIALENDFIENTSEKSKEPSNSLSPIKKQASAEEQVAFTLKNDFIENMLEKSKTPSPSKKQTSAKEQKAFTLENDFIETTSAKSEKPGNTQSPIKKQTSSKQRLAFTLENDFVDNMPEKSKTPGNTSSPIKKQTLAEEQTALTFVNDFIETTPEKSEKPGNTPPSMKKQTSVLQKTYEQLMQPYMSESTASAVDALLSVSREADRVPRIVGSGPPEDLFEDDKDMSNNDDSITNICKDNGIYIDQPMEEEKTEASVQELNGITIKAPIQDNTDQRVETTMECDDSQNNSNKQEAVVENEPTESDLQIAETLLNLPSLQNKVNEHKDIVSTPMLIDDQPENLIETIVTDESDVKTYANEETVTSTETAPENQTNIRFETEQEKSENLNAAQSLVQMSETIDHQMNVPENKSLTNNKDCKAKEITEKEPDKTVEQKIQQLSNENTSDSSNATNKSPKYETTSSKLLKMLEEPITAPKIPFHKITPIKQSPVKQLVVKGKEKILNFDVAKSSLKPKGQEPKQKIIIRRTGTSKTFINNLSDVVSSPDKIILSRSNVPGQDGSSIQTFTIQTPHETNAPSEPKQIVIQPKVRKITRTPTKLQKLKPQNSLMQWTETKTSQAAVTDDAMFDINSMPVLLSDDILTPESIEKMPIVMSDGNIISNATTTKQNIIQTTQTPPKLMKTSKPSKTENEKITISASPSKSEVKTLLMNPVTEVNKVSTTPNILSKSAKLRGGKPMLVIDKATGKQKIIMTKGEPALKEIKHAPPTLIQSAPQPVPKPEKFLILPTGTSPRTGRTQKIVIDPQTGKAHVLVAKGHESPSPMNLPDAKPVSARIIPPSADTSSPGNTVMIITNAQGTQSRIVLTPEHEKILFPNKTIQRIPAVVTASSSSKARITATRIVPKQQSKQQKSAIITSKGQLIVGGRVTTTAHNIAPMPEIRPAPKPEVRPVPKRIVASEPKKLVQAIQKTTTEPLIFLQQKSGTVMQLTAAQFEHLQRTGQIVQKVAPPENKIVVQKSVTLTPKETAAPQKQRVRKSATASPSPVKKAKHMEIAIAPAPIPPPAPPVPPLTSLSNSVSATASSFSTVVPSASNIISVSTSPSFSGLDNFEEMLPSTAIVKQVEPPAPAVVQLPEPAAAPQLEPAAEPPPAQLSDGQLLAVPGEHFGGPPGTFYLCVEDNGTLTPIDNQPLVLENNQLVPMAVEPLPVFAPQPERQDILQAALANSDVFHAEATRDEAPDFRDLNANVSVHCRVSETSTTLNQPIMTPVEVPTEGDTKPTVPSNLDDGLAVIGVTPHTVPRSLELPITVTDPRIAPKTTDPLSNNNYGSALLPSPSTDMSFVTTEETVVAGPISMPLLTDDESVGKSMPILTDEVTERTVSSIESTTGSPSSIDVRESEAEEGGQWSRRLLTPATDMSDISEASAEIPLQPAIQLSVNDLSRHS